MRLFSFPNCALLIILSATTSKRYHMKCKKFADIPKLTTNGSYSVTVPWRSIERTLESYGKMYTLHLDPEFQRAHVWTEDKQIKFVEYILRGGQSSRNIYFNCSAWNNQSKDMNMYLVDGKQRLEAVRRFMNNEIPAFGTFLQDYEDEPDFLRHSFNFCVNDLSSYKEVLQWYIDLNDGGVAHTKEEIDKVRKMLI